MPLTLVWYWRQPSTARFTAPHSIWVTSNISSATIDQTIKGWEVGPSFWKPAHSPLLWWRWGRLGSCQSRHLVRRNMLHCYNLYALHCMQTPVDIKSQEINKKTNTKTRITTMTGTTELRHQQRQQRQQRNWQIHAMIAFRASSKSLWKMLQFLTNMRPGNIKSDSGQHFPDQFIIEYKVRFLHLCTYADQCCAHIWLVLVLLPLQQT